MARYFDTGLEEPELEGQQAGIKFKATYTRRKALSGTQARVAMEKMV